MINFIPEAFRQNPKHMNIKDHLQFNRLSTLVFNLNLIHLNNLIYNQAPWSKIRYVTRIQNQKDTMTELSRNTKIFIQEFCLEKMEGFKFVSPFFSTKFLK